MDLILEAFDFVVEFTFLVFCGGFGEAFSGCLEFFYLGFPHVGLGGDEGVEAVGENGFDDSCGVADSNALDFFADGFYNIVDCDVRRCAGEHFLALFNRLHNQLAHSRRLTSPRRTMNQVHLILQPHLNRLDLLNIHQRIRSLIFLCHTHVMIAIFIPEFEGGGEELINKLGLFMHSVLLKVLEDVEVAAEGDFVPFEDEVAVDAFEVVLLAVLLLSDGEFDFGADAFVDDA
jgi:hypothetical protein